MNSKIVSGLLGVLLVGVLSLVIAVSSTVRAENSTVSAFVPEQATDPQSENALHLTPCTHGGLQAKCGFLRVPEDRTSLNGRKIDIRVVVIPASGNPVEPDPIFWFAGGPGVAATDDVVDAVTVFSPLLQNRDIVLVDQRGVGGSNPLICDTPDPSEMASPDFSLADFARDCAASLDADPRFYTTRIAMDDVDEVRVALGYELINLYGGSYGATAAQVYLLNHEEHVRSVVLVSGSLLDVPLFEWMAFNSQRALDLLFARCAADARCNAAYPNVRSEFLGLLEQLEREPADVEVIDPATNTPVPLSRNLFTAAVHSMLIDIETSSQLPRYIHRAHESGDLKPFTSFLQVGAAQSIPVMPQVILCSEDWAAYSPEAIAQHGQGSYYTDSRVAAAESQVEGCGLLPTAQEQAHLSPASTSSVPVLLVNGEADPQDPPQNVAGAKQLWPNSLSVVLPAQGHSLRATPCLKRMIEDFVVAGSAEALDTACVDDIPVLRFDVRS